MVCSRSHTHTQLVHYCRDHIGHVSVFDLYDHHNALFTTYLPKYLFRRHNKCTNAEYVATDVSDVLGVCVCLYVLVETKCLYKNTTIDLVGPV